MGRRMEEMFEPLFPLGNVTATQGFASLCQEADADMRATAIELLLRHGNGDYGDVCADDAEANRLAIEGGSRILSRYQVLGAKVYVITEWDRSLTTVLLADEY